MSFQVESNAEAVNVAGRQRMLSQRISKSLLDTQAQLNTGANIESSLNELKSASSMFNSTFKAFKLGGEITGTNGEKSFLPKAESEEAQSIIKEAELIWQPFYKDISETIEALEVNSSASLTFLKKSTNFARQNVNTLLKLMNDLTNEQERAANSAASQSRLIQAFGIIIALLCFMVIMYRIFGQLRLADTKAESAKRETDQIFSTVNQGLFLLDKDFKIGEQHSQELEKIFANNNFKNLSFSTFLKKMVSENDMDNIKRYMKLLFDPHKKQRLITDLNPLNEVSVQVKDGNQIENKFLRFNFKRVYNEGAIDRVLTSVSDITREIKLAKELDRESKRSEKQLEMVSAMMDADQTLMPIYLKNSNDALNKINDLLKISSRDSAQFKQKALTMMNTIHSVKGESAALSLNNISELCHEFESDLKLIMDKEDYVDGHDFVAATVVLNKLMSYNTTLHELFNSIFGDKKTKPAPQNVVNWDHLYNYVKEVAERQNKQVRLQLSGLNTPDLEPELASCISTISTQFVRNAISHGIESSHDRKQSNKSPIGTLSISLFENVDGSYRYVFNDDGAGINFEKIAKLAIDKGLIESEDAQSIPKSKLVNLLFSSNLSTADKVDNDKGRGVGMSSILEAVNKLGGSMGLKTNAVIGTTFTINFPKDLGNASKIAA